jgi:hypothetical protein
MNISDEQVRKAIEILKSGHYGDAGVDGCGVNPDVLERAMRVVAAAPETREDRVEAARWMLAEHPPTSDEVAAKMLSRMVSDTLR